MFSTYARLAAATALTGIGLSAPLIAKAQLLGTSAYAAEELATSSDALADKIVVTGHWLPEGAAELKGRPGGTDLVRADQYEDQVAVSLRDALAFSPGVYAQPRFGQEVRLSIRGSGISRGYHMRGLTLLQDGIPINLADDNGDFQELDPLLFDRIEVYRGASAFRFGGTTLGGAINGVTPTGRTAKGALLRLDGGSYETARGFASYGYAGEDVDAWVAINGDRSDGDRMHSERNGLRVNGNIGWQPTERIQTRFYVSANRLRQKIPGALDYATVISDPASGNLAGNQSRDIDSIRLQNRTNVNLGDVDLEGGVFLNLKRLHHPIYQLVAQESNDRGVFARLGWSRGPFQLLTGVTARFGTIDSKRFVNVNGTAGARTFDADLHARTIDVYAEGRLDLGHHVTAIAGGIYTSGERRQAQSFPTTVLGSADFHEFSPRFGLLWDARPNLQIYGNVSRSHELPGFIELAQVASFVPLDAQHAWTVELGMRGNIGPAKVDVSVYSASVRNELLQFNVGRDIPASTFNADKTIHRGIEAGLDLPLSDWAMFRSVYQYNDFGFDGDRQYGDNRLPVIPKNLFRAQVRLGPQKWSITPSIEWVPQGPWADYRNSFRTAGYTSFSLGGTFAAGKTTEFFADLRNFTDEKAAGDVSAVIAYDARSAIFSPIQRRSIFIGVRQRLGGTK